MNKVEKRQRGDDLCSESSFGLISGFEATASQCPSCDTHEMLVFRVITAQHELQCFLMELEEDGGWSREDMKLKGNNWMPPSDLIVQFDLKMILSFNSIAQMHVFTLSPSSPGGP